MKNKNGKPQPAGSVFSAVGIKREIKTRCEENRGKNTREHEKRTEMKVSLKKRSFNKKRKKRSTGKRSG